MHGVGLQSAVTRVTHVQNDVPERKLFESRWNFVKWSANYSSLLWLTAVFPSRARFERTKRNHARNAVIFNYRPYDFPWLHSFDTHLLEYHTNNVKWFLTSVGLMRNNIFWNRSEPDQCFPFREQRCEVRYQTGCQTNDQSTHIRDYFRNLPLDFRSLSLFRVHLDKRGCWRRPHHLNLGNKCEKIPQLLSSSSGELRSDRECSTRFHESLRIGYGN